MGSTWSRKIEKFCRKWTYKGVKDGSKSMTMENSKKIADKSRDIHQIIFLSPYSESTLKNNLFYKFWAIKDKISKFEFFDRISGKIFDEKKKMVQNRSKFIGRGILQRWFRIWTQKNDMMYVTWVIGDFLRILHRHAFLIVPYTLVNSFPAKFFCFSRSSRTHSLRENYRKFSSWCTSSRKIKIFEIFFRNFLKNLIFRDPRL